MAGIPGNLRILARRIDLGTGRHSVYDVGVTQSGSSYLVMELVEGDTLAERLRKGPLSMEQVLRYGAEIAGAIPDSLAQFSPQLRRSSPGNENYSKAVSIDLRFGGGGVMNRHAHEGRRNENP